VVKCLPDFSVRVVFAVRMTVVRGEVVRLSDETLRVSLPKALLPTESRFVGSALAPHRRDYRARGCHHVRTHRA
jgi:hypothetical protein